MPKLFAVVVSLMLSGCVEEGADVPDSPVTPHADPVEQCHLMADAFCVAAYDCGWDPNTGPCAEYYGSFCESNQTTYSPRLFERALVGMANYECADNEAWIIWSRPAYAAMFDAMLMWAAEAQ